MTTSSSGDPVAAILDQLAAHASQLTGYHADVAGLAARLDAVAALTAALDARLTALAADTDNENEEEGGYRPAPSRRWWQLHGEAREQAVSVLRGWVEQVYRPAGHPRHH